MLCVRRAMLTVLLVLLAGFAVAGPSAVQAALTCSCPPKYCEKGKADGCAIECPSGQEAVCVCSAFCDESGNGSGLNRCGCQPLVVEDGGGD